MQSGTTQQPEDRQKTIIVSGNVYLEQIPVFIFESLVMMKAVARKSLSCCESSILDVLPRHSVAKGASPWDQPSPGLGHRQE